jgi:DNA-directed RNA polymerase subunit RPC12/RpoP
MSITVYCKCGKSLTAPDNAEGRHGKCPACGDRILITADVPLVLNEAAVSKIQVKSVVDLGVVKCRFSELKFSWLMMDSRVVPAKGQSLTLTASCHEPERCARTRRNPGTAAGSPGEFLGAVAANSEATTRILPVY